MSRQYDVLTGIWCMRLKKKKKTKLLKKDFRLSEEELNELQLKANLYTEGNLSEWIVYAGINYVPKKSELTN